MLELFNVDPIVVTLPKKAHSAIKRNVKINNQDFYATPPIIIEKLLLKEEIVGSVYEPACGEGHISKVLINKGINVFSSDLYYRGFGETKDFF